MTGGDGQSFAVVVFLGFVAVSLLLCGLAAADLDDPEHFYAGGGAAFGPVGGGLAIAGDYISAATLLSTTGAVALDGADGMLFAGATVLSLFLVMRILGEPLRRAGVFTLGDFLADRLDDPSVRRALGVASLFVLTPLLLVQLTTAGRILAAMFGLPDGALTACTIAGGALMIAYAAIGGMRGVGYVQILKVGVVLIALALLAGIVLARYGWSPLALFDAARDRSGAGTAYGRPGLHFGPSLAGRLDLISFQATLLIGAACLPHLTMRLHPLKDALTARRAVGWAVGPVAVVCTGVVVAGLGACALIGRDAIRAADPGGATALLMVTGALDPVAGGARHSMLFAVVACAVFATTLAAVAGITLAAASSLTRDLGRRSAHGAKNSSAAGEIRRARLGIVAVGVVAVVLSAALADRGRLTLISLSFTVAASVLAPVLLYALFLPRWSATGVRWTVYGTIPLIVLLLTGSPAVTGSPLAVFPDHDLHWFPLQTPGLITIPVGFLLGLVGRPRSRATSPQQVWQERVTVGRGRSEWP
ncbi:MULTISPECIES: cation acetate symporter [unclassified Streptomyces]|uniref:sodium/solute symporter n=1 Tax=unclassified Streptomyces TaxID=2593676 RepID=UPI000DB98A37|nr:cation acetate symporter [Streptomyces sp. PsTaAH-137]MYT73512.1 cation acetate symporter [Streptomyces sp. SID8367]RAJ85047.1 cation/acetate symporter [Streptomyces sp. PsTaAH-137]